MYDWTDDFCWQACMSFPSLRFHIMQAIDLGDTDRMIDLLFAIESERGVA